MRKFIKFQFSSLISTGVDYTVMLVLTELLGMWYILSSLFGFISGGITNFYINKNWVFKSEKNRMQIIRYIIIWIGNLSINISGLYVLTEWFHFDYKISKVVVSLFIGVLLSFFVQQRLVFKYFKNEE